MPRQPNSLDLVAEDLADWIDNIANQMADAMTAGQAAPFAARITAREKLEYYTAKLFNPDGTPNVNGRAQEMNRLGPEQFALAFKVVTKARPDLAMPNPPVGAGPLGAY